MRLDDYDFDLPTGLVAQHPAERRDESRLLVLSRAGDPLRHLRFRDLPDLLRPEDTLVLNRTRVVPARLRGHKERTGGRIELLLLRREADAADAVWLAMARPLRGLRGGDGIVLDHGGWRLEVVERLGDRLRLRLPDTAPAETGDPTGFAGILRLVDAVGEIPLPPYIRRAVEAPDRERYQTVYASDPGSIAAPTAGLHFTDALLDSVRRRGIGVVSVVLHVGPGTFEPVRAADPRQHRLEAEYYQLRPEIATEIDHRRAAGGRVIAVGTTTVRVLESCWHDGRLVAGEGWTDLLICPPRRIGAIDALVTNFHLPRSSLLFLVSALIGRERLLAAYEEAIRSGYRFYSYGDAMLIL